MLKKINFGFLDPQWSVNHPVSKWYVEDVYFIGNKEFLRVYAKYILYISILIQTIKITFIYKTVFPVILYKW